MIKNVVFDMGNVLVQWMPKYIVNRLIEDDKYSKIIEDAVFNHSDWNKLDLGLITEDELLENAKNRVPEEAYDDLEEVIDSFHYCMPVIVETNELVKSLKEKGYKLFLLSNAGKRFHSYFRENVPCHKYFDGCMISADEHLRKPSEEFYNKFLQKFELFANECIFIDDLQENCNGAEKVGIKTICFNGDCEKLISDLKENKIEI